MKKIIASLGMLVFAGAIVASGTGAFFNDTETSTGNTFAAGDIDLKIDNSSYATDCNIPGLGVCTGALAFSSTTSWSLRDLTIEKFFNFIDLKPGDTGEDTISIHVGSNDAWVCAAARVTSDQDNSITEPEDAVSPAAGDGTADGDLDTDLNFAFWKDDGDNVLETNEVASIFAAGSLSNLNSAGKIALSDAQGTNPFGNAGIAGGSTVYVGKIWCYGGLTPNAVTQNGNGSSTPLQLGTGWTCNGAPVGNIGQTDSVSGDLQFYAVQKRNNANFSCEDNFTPFPQS